MKDHYLDICNCPECSYFDMGKAHCCGLPERITARDVPRIKETIQNCLYDTGRELVFGDRLLTLVTCEYSQNNGRLAVIAVKE